MFGLLERVFGLRRQKRFAAWQIELTTRCPLACRMCIRHGRPWRNADMALDDFKKLVPYLGEVETAILQGWGEPLLHRDLVEIVRLTKAVEPKRCTPAVGFVTSGKGMDRRYAAELVAAGLDFIGFSLAGVTASTHSAIRVHSDFQELVSAVEHVRAVKQERRLERPRVHVAFLMLKGNVHELPELPELARRMGAEEVVLTNLIDVVDEWQDEQKVFGPEGEERYGEILARTERNARDSKIALRASALSPSSTPVCEEDPLRNLFVSVEGDVSPCVYLCPPVPPVFTRRYCGHEHQARKVRFGNLFREPLDAVWSNPEYAEFRDRFRRRERGSQFLSTIRSASPQGLGASQLELPDPPEPCRICHKMLGV